MPALDELLDPGLVADNPLDVWGTGADTEGLFTGCLRPWPRTTTVQAVALAVDLVEEYDGDESYPAAALAAAAATTKPVAVLANLGSAIDPVAADRLRAGGVPVLEGTRTGLSALRHLLDRSSGPVLPPPPPPVDTGRRARWTERLARGPLNGPEGFSLLADYGIPVARSVAVAGEGEAVGAARSIGFPVVLKTDEPGIAHKSDVGGVALGLADAPAVAAAYRAMADRLGPRAVVSEQAGDGVDLLARPGPRPAPRPAGGRGGGRRARGAPGGPGRATPPARRGPGVGGRRPSPRRQVARRGARCRPRRPRRRWPRPSPRCPCWPSSWATTSPPSTSIRCAAGPDGCLALDVLVEPA